MVYVGTHKVKFRVSQGPVCIKEVIRAREGAPNLIHDLKLSERCLVYPG